MEILDRSIIKENSREYFIMKRQKKNIQAVPEKKKDCL